MKGEDSGYYLCSPVIHLQIIFSLSTSILSIKCQVQTSFTVRNDKEKQQKLPGVFVNNLSTQPTVQPCYHHRYSLITPVVQNTPVNQTG